MAVFVLAARRLSAPELVLRLFGAEADRCGAETSGPLRDRPGDPLDECQRVQSAHRCPSEFEDRGMTHATVYGSASADGATRIP